MSTKPTDAQAALYRWLIWHIERFGFQPSRMEMAKHFGVSISAVKDRLKGLQERKLITLTGIDRGVFFPKVGFCRLVLDKEEALKVAREADERFEVSILAQVEEVIRGLSSETLPEPQGGPADEV